MRLFRLVALVALILASTLAAADSIDFQGAGMLANHTAFTRGKIAAGHSWEVGNELIEIKNLTTGRIQTGNLGTFDVTSGILFGCSSGLCFHGGSLDIDNLKGKDIFLGKLVTGTILQLHGVTILTAKLASGATTVIRVGHGTFSSQALVSSHGAVIPEPATLSLIGIGLLAIGLVRRNRLQSDVDADRFDQPF